MKTSHTPGPFVVERTTSLGMPGHAIKSKDCTLAFVYGVNDGSTANANLFASAPELLAALADLLEQSTGPVAIYGDGCGSDGKKTGLSHWEFNALREDRIAKARAAIAKATP